eukprot:1949249-Rhodomonas_salina.2
MSGTETRYAATRCEVESEQLVVSTDEVSSAISYAHGTNKAYSVLYLPAHLRAWYKQSVRCAIPAYAHAMRCPVPPCYPPTHTLCGDHATGCYNSTRTRTDRVYGATRYYAMSGTDVAVCDQMIGPEPIWNTKFVIPVHGEIKDIQPPLEYILYQERGCALRGYKSSSTRTAYGHRSRARHCGRPIALFA